MRHEYCNYRSGIDVTAFQLCWFQWHPSKNGGHNSNGRRDSFSPTIRIRLTSPNRLFLLRFCGRPWKKGTTRRRGYTCPVSPYSARSDGRLAARRGRRTVGRSQKSDGSFFSRNPSSALVVVASLLAFWLVVSPIESERNVFSPPPEVFPSKTKAPEVTFQWLRGFWRSVEKKHVGTFELVSSASNWTAHNSVQIRMCKKSWDTPL